MKCRSTLLPLLFLSVLSGGGVAHAQTIFTVVLGNQNHVVGSSTLESGLFRSEDRGETWEQLGPRNLKAYAMDAVLSEKGRVLYLAAGNGIHRSVDSGKNWKIVTDWRMTEVLDVAVNQKNPEFIYAATPFGLWWSEDGGDSWQRTEGELGRTYIYRVEHTAYGRNGTLHLFTDMRQLPSFQITSDSGPVRPWMIRESNRVYYLPDSVGVTPSMASAITIEHNDCVWDNAYDVIGVNPGTRNLQTRTVYTDSNRVMEQMGSTYGSMVSCEGPFAPVGSPLPSPVHALAALNADWPYRLIAGTFGDGVFTFDNGEWKQIGLPGAQVWSIEIFDF